MGLLIHALGDAYAHTYVDMNPTLGSPSRLRRNPHYKQERLYGPGIGHLLAGHTPDFIGHDPANYGDYVDQLYGILSALPNAGVPKPQWIAGLEDRANGFSGPSFSDFFKPEHLNGQEVAALRGLLGGYGESAYKYDPDSKDQPPTLPGMQQDLNFRDTLIDKIKNGVKGCCPKK